jgi:hypothetical protein
MFNLTRALAGILLKPVKNLLKEEVIRVLCQSVDMFDELEYLLALEINIAFPFDN